MGRKKVLSQGKSIKQKQNKEFTPKKLINMKKIILLFSLLLPTFLFAQEEVIWDFPVKPGSEEWGNLKTETERQNAMQIPSDILLNMGTEELVITCINYPDALKYRAYSNDYIGIEKVIEGFNGLRELLKRKDALTYLTDIYQNAGVEGLEKKDTRIDERFWPLKFRYIELLLSQDSFISSSNDEDVENLLKVSVEKTNLKTNKTSYFSKYDNIISSYIIAKALSKLKVSEFTSNEEYMNFALKRKLKTYEQAVEIIEIGKRACSNFN